MHIVLAGPGALGCLLASILISGNSNGANSISILDYHKNRATQISTNGILYEAGQNQINHSIKAFSNPEQLGMVDAVFLCVKSYDIEESLQFCSPLLEEHTLLIFMQNGMAHLERDVYASKAIPLLGTTTEGATSLGAGHVRHAGIGTTYLGFLEPQQEKYVTLLQAIIDLLQIGGMEVHHSQSIHHRLWAKLIINVGINALTAIHNCSNGKLLTIPEAKEIMTQAVAEAQQVAYAEGITISNPLQKTSDVCQATAENISSMLQDVHQNKITEIEAINGAVTQMAAKYNIATPVNDMLVRRVKEIEKNYT